MRKIQLSGKVKDKVEMVFAAAVSMAESVRLKNDVFCIGNQVWILSHDRAVIFTMEVPYDFGDGFGFPVDYYDGADFEVEDGVVVFQRTEGGWERARKVPKPSMELEEFKGLIGRVKAMSEQLFKIGSLKVDSKLLRLLEQRLSHVEFAFKDGEWLIIQRDVYSGEVSIIKPQTKGLLIGGGGMGVDGFVFGMRTRDLFGAFMLDDILELRFYSPSRPEEVTPDRPGEICKVISGRSGKFVGWVGGCRFDGLGELSMIGGDTNGRQKQKEHQSQQGLGETDNGGATAEAGGSQELRGQTQEAGESKGPVRLGRLKRINKWTGRLL